MFGLNNGDDYGGMLTPQDQWSAMGSALRAVSALHVYSDEDGWIDHELPLAEFPVVPAGTPFLHALAGLIRLWRGLDLSGHEMPNRSAVVTGMVAGRPMAWITAPAPAYGAVFATSDPIAKLTAGRLLVALADEQSCATSAEALKAVAEAMGPIGPVAPRARAA